MKDIDPSAFLHEDKGVDIEVSQERFKFLIRKIIIFDGQLAARKNRNPQEICPWEKVCRASFASSGATSTFFLDLRFHARVPGLLF